MRVKRPGTEAEWELWYQDTFDRECPRQVEAAGRGLMDGLIALWAHHLLETVQANGQKGFSRFNLWWGQEGKSVEIRGAWEGQVRLRGWIYGAAGRDAKPTARTLLRKVAATHQECILRGDSSEAILTAAKTAESRAAFEERLSHLA